MIPTIAIVRETTRLTDTFVASYARAQQIQVTRDFAPIWDLDATVIHVSPGDAVPPDAWVVALLDNSDQADALGYHDLTEAGSPLSKVFVADALDDGLAWTVTASHEVLEMLADPRINGTVTIGDTEYALEVCDAPEDDRFSYPVEGHHLSAFVTPAWFDLLGKAPFTFPAVSMITAPLMLAPGGYIGRRAMGGAWAQVMADEAGPRQVKRGSSRTGRRFGVAAA